MIGDSIRSIVDLLVFRKMPKKLGAELEEAPSDFEEAGDAGTPHRIDDILKRDPHAAEMHAVQAIPLSAYVSFAHSDADFAESLRTTLQQRHEVSAFLKDDRQRAPDYFDRVIPWAIEAADIFIVLLSPETMGSNYLGRELQLALQLHKRVVPVYVEAFDLGANAPTPFDQLRNIPALHLEEMSIEEVAQETARLMRPVARRLR
ncbi:toll/interleukin-1 receptor domain-containing protein [Variovorax sp. WS11]|uniref:toll/interleukin-1 receptor domain-containing protein n=1 Tax=Variovorax sp. WS11 TaxID=1105204 RepID=UPI0013DD3510|nr:toll/interleukin-1 receptor domain-containing protein [Variovorax sp. WS11]NDZ18682.1 toll/interleukin-1 receptor domain-containing protein [Variovorax sp. WS11]